MKKTYLILGTCILALAGCDYEDTDGFNTSEGAGVTVNFSGVYTGRSGGEIVQGAGISTLVLSQAGNSVQVSDDHGATYQGTVGSPAAVSAPSADGTYPAGVEMVQAQINFSGADSDGKQVQFVGVLHAVTVTDVQGTTTAATSTHNTNQTLTTTISVTSGVVVVRNVTTEQNDEGLTTTANTTYTLTEANTQYVLQGNWVGEGTHYVDGISSGSSGIITVAHAAD